MNKFLQTTIKLFFHLALLSLILNSDTYAQSFSLRVNIDKRDYFLKEGIYILVTITNTSTEPILVRDFSPFNGKLKINIQNDEGRVFPCKIRIYDLPVSIGILLMPNDSLVYPTGLCQYWGDNDTPSPLFRHFSEDKYKLMATYTQAEKSSVSNAIVFNVIQPSGADREEYERLFNAEKFQSSLNRREIIQAFELFVADKHNSIYIKDALYFLYLIYSVSEGDREAGKLYRGTLLSKYPNTLIALTNIFGIPPEEYEELIQKKYIPENLDKDATTLIGRYNEVARPYLNEKRYKKVKIEQQD
jgi:hypothetical protein